MLNSEDLTTLAEKLDLSVPSGYELKHLEVKSIERGFEALFTMNDDKGITKYNKATYFTR